jgi:hypothetical protein
MLARWPPMHPEGCHPLRKPYNCPLEGNFQVRPLPRPPAENAPEPDRPACGAGPRAALPSVETLALNPVPPVPDLAAALRLANREAASRLAAPMLLSWYDRDRDFESPQHASECHHAGAIPGYVDYALSRGAALKVDVETGRFVFFYLDAQA